MTANQISFANVRETIRHNLVSEMLGRDTLEETHRHNVSTESLQAEQNAVNKAHYERQDAYNALHYATMDAETARHNLAGEAETQRHNIESEYQARASLGETIRSNTTRERETERHNTVVEQETHRSNIKSEKELHRSNVAKEKENHRSNVANETISAENAETNRINAETNITNAKTNRINAETRQSELTESIRHNQTNELIERRKAGETARHNYEMEYETNRHNIATEELSSGQLNVTVLDSNVKRRNIEADTALKRKQAGLVAQQKEYYAAQTMFSGVSASGGLIKWLGDTAVKVLE